MEALSIDLYDEESRAKIEALQWQFAQDLLTLGLTVIIEWGTWARSERDTLRLKARALGAGVELRYVTAPLDVLFERLQHRGQENPPIEQDDCADGPKYSRSRHRRRWRSLTSLWSQTRSQLKLNSV